MLKKISLQQAFVGDTEEHKKSNLQKTILAPTQRWDDSHLVPLFQCYPLFQLHILLVNGKHTCLKHRAQTWVALHDSLYKGFAVSTSITLLQLHRLFCHPSNLTSLSKIEDLDGWHGRLDDWPVKAFARR